MMYDKHLIAPLRIPNSDGWQTAVYAVGPAEAEELLENNSGNRKLSPSSVARYAAAMRKGDWKTSPEPLIFSPSGRLMNGQTRLHAIKVTGEPQKFLFIFGVADDVFSVLDRGRPRTLSDAHGVDKKTAEIARLLARITFPVPSAGSAVSDSDFLRIVKLIQEPHDTLRGYTTTASRYFGSAAFRSGAVARILAGENPDFVGILYRNLNTGHVEDIPPVGAAAARAVLTGRWVMMAGEAGAHLALARSWSLFQKAEAHRTRVPINDPSTQIREVQATLLRAIADTENV